MPPDGDDEIEILEVVGVDNPDEMEPEPCAGPPDAPASAPEPIDELAEAVRDRDRLQDLLLRTRADFENFQKRTARDSERQRTRVSADLLRHILPVLDNLERALQSGAPADDPMREGVALIHQQLLDTLVKEGLEPLDTLGKAFDPQLHEAVEVRSAEGFEPGTILEEMLKGYKYKDTLLRPALVRVAAGRQTEDGSAEGTPAR